MDAPVLGQSVTVVCKRPPCTYVEKGICLLSVGQQAVVLWDEHWMRAYSCGKIAVISSGGELPFGTDAIRVEASFAHETGGRRRVRR